MMTKKILLSLIVSLCAIGLFGQEIIRFEKLKTVTKETIQASYFVQALYDVDVFLVHYTTKKISLELDTASGIISIPVDDNLKFPVLVYEHGTVGSRDEVPSRGSFAQTISTIYASFGYHCIAPDYIGLGISKGLHPYLHSESEAWATIDMIKAVKTLSEDYPIYYNEQIFVTGYSQGGHAAMATCRALQDEPDLHLTAAAPMSGPYNVSKEMKLFTLGDDPYSFCGYLGSVVLSAKYTNPELLKDIEVEDIFKPEYAALVREYEAETKGLFSINNQMIALLNANEGIVQPKLMLKEDIRNALLTDPNHPLQKALEKMDVYDWVPEVPIRMIYCKDDDQVTYRNAVSTDSIMNANGALHVSSIDVNSSANHSTCYTPASFEMRDFLLQYQEIGVVGTNLVPLSTINIQPNPVIDQFSFELAKDNQNESISISIKDITGKLVLMKKSRSNNKIHTIDISTLQPGVLFIEINTSNTILAHEKIIKI